jgi:hypothetical protein
MRQSLLNTPTPPFNGAANSLYGPRGPQRQAPDYAARKPLSDQPQSIEHHIDDALARIPDLTGRQRNALRAELVRMTRSIDFIRCVSEQAHGAGPHSAVAFDEGRPLA